MLPPIEILIKLYIDDNYREAVNIVLKFTPKGIYEISKILDVSLKEEDVQSV